MSERERFKVVTIHEPIHNGVVISRFLNLLEKGECLHSIAPIASGGGYTSGWLIVIERLFPEE